MTSKIPSKDKLRELIVYVAGKCANDSKFGATKMNKILFLSDFLHYANFGESITGEQYWNLKNGPAPKMFMQVQNDLLRKKDVVVVTEPVFTHSKKRLVATREPDLNLFSAQEISFVDYIIEKTQSLNNSQSSDLSHMLSVGWQNTQQKEVIPYSTIFLPREMNYSEEDAIYAELLMRRKDWAEKYGWTVRQPS